MTKMHFRKVLSVVDFHAEAESGKTIVEVSARFPARRCSISASILKPTTTTSSIAAKPPKV